MFLWGLLLSISEVQYQVLCLPGIGKFVLLCHLITTRKSDLTGDERLEIIRYAKSRLPMFLKQLHQLMKTVKATFNGMTSMQRLDIATFVVPEVKYQSIQTCKDSLTVCNLL